MLHTLILDHLGSWLAACIGGIALGMFRRYVRSPRLRTALESVDRLAMAVVASLCQSTVSALKASGGWNADAKANVKRRAIDILRALGGDAITTLRASHSDEKVDDILGHFVEKAVVDLNARTGGAP